MSLYGVVPQSWLRWFEQAADWLHGRDREIDVLIGAQRASLEAHRQPGDPEKTARLGRHAWVRVVKAQRRNGRGRPCQH